MSASERAFIGVVINGGTRASGHDLHGADFGDLLCRQLFEACCLLEAQGRTADIVTLCDMKPEDMEAIVQLAGEAAVSGALAEQYAQNIREGAQRGQIAALGLETAKRARETDVPVSTVLDEARLALDSIGARETGGSVQTGTDAVCGLLLHLDSREAEPAVPIGLPRLDARLGGGLHGGRLCIIGARPAVGKSALLSFAAVHALKEGRRVLYISLEMSEREVVSRMAAQVSGVDVGRMETRTLTDEDYSALACDVPHVLDERLWISTAVRTPGGIRRLALKMKASGGLDAVMVDYLQLLYPDVKTSGRVEAVGEISRALKLLAMELSCPVIAAAQVNRASTIGEDRPPRLSELRESGSIEQDADIVFLLHCPQEEVRGGERTVELYVAKNRQGRCGRMDLHFDGGRMRYTQAD